MRTFGQYLFFFRDDSSFKSLIKLVEEDTSLPIREKDPEQALKYFAENPRYEALFNQIEYLHNRYMLNLDPSKRILWKPFQNARPQSTG